MTPTTTPAAAVTMTACSRCGQLHQRVSATGKLLPTCVAHKADGDPCRNWPIKGGTVCSQRHGGRTQAVQAKAAERVAVARARELVDLLDVGPCEDPVNELLRMAAQAVALADALRGVVSRLETVSARGALGGEVVKAEMQAYMTALARAESILGKIISLDLEARRVSISQRQADALVAALEAVVGHRDLALNPHQRRRALELVGSELDARK